MKLSYEEPIKILCDNKSTICIAHDSVYHDRMKHVDIDEFYIKEKVEEKIIRLVYVCSAEHCADILTRELQDKNFSRLVSKLGMRSIHSCA